MLKVVFLSLLDSFNSAGTETSERARDRQKWREGGREREIEVFRLYVDSLTISLTYVHAD